MGRITLMAGRRTAEWRSSFKSKSITAPGSVCRDEDISTFRGSRRCSTADKTADALATDGLRIGRLEAEAPEAPSGDDASMLASEFGIGRDRPGGCEVEIALQWKAQRAADGGEF